MTDALGPELTEKIMKEMSIDELNRSEEGIQLVLKIITSNKKIWQSKLAQLLAIRSKKKKEMD